MLNLYDFLYQEAVYCEFWTKLTVVEQKKGLVQFLEEHHGHPYRAAFILCPIPLDIHTTSHVSVTVNPSSPSMLTERLPLQDLEERLHLGTLSVCVKSMHSEYNDALALIEFIEVYSLLGVDKFTFYKHSVGKDVEKVLDYYDYTGKVQVLPWSIPLKLKKVIILKLFDNVLHV